MSTFSLCLFALMVAHALCDYPLQGDFLSRAKNVTAPIPGVPWVHAMFAHCCIHAGAVWAVTGLWWLGALEFALHFITDHQKCLGRISFAVDQGLHIWAKVGWAACVAMVGNWCWLVN